MCICMYRELPVVREGRRGEKNTHPDDMTLEEKESKELDMVFRDGEWVEREPQIVRRP